MMSIRKTGDWDLVSKVLRAVTVRLSPAFRAKIEETGELILETLKGHIDAQDLSWTPLSARTIELKGGDDTIYVETGWFYNNLEVKKVKSTSQNITFFIGGSNQKVHPESGVKLDELFIWLEYGTDKIPPRPLVRPTEEELEPIVKAVLGETFEAVIGGV
jgi:hypothetical protein